MGLGLNGTIAIVLLVGSIIGWAVSALFFRAKLLQQSGAIEVDKTDRTHEVHYPVDYAKPPKLEVRKSGSPQYRTADVTKQTATGFTAQVRRTYSTGAGINAGATLQWASEGLPDEKTDPRGKWARMALPEKFFASTTMIGAIANVGEFWQFLLGLLSR
jgi:hypothetical protein